MPSSRHLRGVNTQASSAPDPVTSTWLQVNGTQGICCCCLAVGQLPPPLAVLLVGLFLTLSRRLRKRLRARQEAGTVQAVNLDKEAGTRAQVSCSWPRCSPPGCRWGGGAWAADGCRGASRRGRLPFISLALKTLCGQRVVMVLSRGPPGHQRKRNSAQVLELRPAALPSAASLSVACPAWWGVGAGAGPPRHINNQCGPRFTHRPDRGEAQLFSSQGSRTNAGSDVCKP